jgi:hypothetical protein
MQHGKKRPSGLDFTASNRTQYHPQLSEGSIRELFQMRSHRQWIYLSGSLKTDQSITMQRMVAILHCRNISHSWSLCIYRLLTLADVHGCLYRFACLCEVDGPTTPTWRGAFLQQLLEHFRILEGPIICQCPSLGLPPTNVGL